MKKVGQEAGWSDEELNQMVLHEVSYSTLPPPLPIRESGEQSKGYFLESPKLSVYGSYMIIRVVIRIPMEQISLKTPNPK